MVDLLAEAFAADTCFLNVSLFFSKTGICFCCEPGTCFSVGNNASRVAKLVNIVLSKCLWKRFLVQPGLEGNKVSRSKICFCTVAETYFASGNIASRIAKLKNVGETCAHCRCFWKHVFPVFLWPNQTAGKGFFFLFLSFYFFWDTALWLTWLHCSLLVPRRSCPFIFQHHQLHVLHSPPLTHTPFNSLYPLISVVTWEPINLRISYHNTFEATKVASETTGF